MKSFFKVLLTAMVIMPLVFSCKTLNTSGTGPIDYSPMFEKLNEMQELLDNAEFGVVDGTYPVESGDALKAAIDRLRKGISMAIAGEIVLQYEVDMYLVQADKDINAFKRSLKVTLKPGDKAELIVFGVGAGENNGYIDFGESPKFTESNTYSVEFWLKINDDYEIGEMGDIISTFNVYKSEKTEGWTVNFMGANLRTTIAMGPQVGRVLEWGVTSPMVKEVWKHIVAVYDENLPENQLKMYVDGELFWEHSNDIYDFDGIQQHYSPATEDCRMWAFKRPTNTGCGIVGFLKNFRLWSVAKSRDEIRELMHSEVEGNEPDLVCAWDFTTVPEDEENIPDKTGQFSAKIVGMHTWNRIEE